MKLTATAAILALTALPVMAQEVGDIEEGKKAFNQCQTCHVVQNEAGEVLAGRNAKTGPNLYGVFGRQAGTYPDFKYGDDIVAAGAKGLIWDEASFIAYTKNPTEFLKEYLEDPRARGMMQFRVRNESDAYDLYAFISSLSPAAAAAPAEGEAPAANP
jgi:cytochrome c